MKDRAKLKGITYKARTVKLDVDDIAKHGSTIDITKLQIACYGQPDCRCMHCQQGRDYLDRIGYIMRNG